MGFQIPISVTQTRQDEEFWRARPSLAAPGLSRHGGRGLVALAAIGKGALIERACTVEIHEVQAKPLDDMRPLGDYYFAHPENVKAGLMAFGLMVLCNHAEDANADILWWKSPALGWFADLVARRDISAGDEITFRYRCPLWFSASAE